MVRHVVKREEGKPVVFRVVNPRLIIVSPIDRSAEIVEDGEIVGLDYNGELGVKRGDVLPIKGHKYKPKIFKKILKSDNFIHGEGYYLYTTELSKSATFVLPLFGGNVDKFHYSKYLMNVYLGVDSKVDREHVYLWYRYVPSAGMDDFEAYIMEHPSYVGHDDVDNYHVLYKMRIPKAYKRDFNLILDGKYSQISDQAKDRILDFHDFHDDSPVGQILFKCSKRKKKIEKDLGVTLDNEAELYDKIDLDKEVFTQDNVIKHVNAIEETKFKLIEDGKR
jgi:hypothetical protein